MIRVALEDGSEVELGPAEVEIRLLAKEGFAAAASGGQVVVLDTHVTDTLRRAGMAREVINRIQRARKDMDLAFDDRIAVQYIADGELADAMAEHAERIAGETLASTFAAGGGSKDGTSHQTEVEGSGLTLSITRA